MMPLLDLGPTIHRAAAEIGIRRYGQLLTPLTQYADQGLEYGIDNGSFKRYEEKKYFRLIDRQLASRERCLWVVLPDVLGCWARTRALFWMFVSKLAGWPRAIVLQNGLDLSEIPWQHLAAVFIGGDDEFKYSKIVKQAISKAKSLGKLVHIGRVNGANRFDYFESLGADSFDGTGVCRFRDRRVSLLNATLFSPVTNKQPQCSKGA